MENSNQNFWKANNTWLQKLTIDDAKFIFDQSEKRFLDTIETAKKIYDRYYGLLTLLCGLLISLTAYSIARWESIKLLDPLLVTSISAAFYFLCLGLVFIFENISPKEFELPGTSPGKYFIETLFNKNLPDKDRILKLYLVEIINYKQRIEENDKKNNESWDSYNLCLKFIFCSPLVISTIFLICIILNSKFNLR